MRWKTIVRYWDIETGEQLTKWDYIGNYIKIKFTKDAKINKQAFRGTITIDIICRRKERTQGKLFE